MTQSLYPCILIRPVYESRHPPLYHKAYWAILILLFNPPFHPLPISISRCAEYGFYLSPFLIFTILFAFSFCIAITTTGGWKYRLKLENSCIVNTGHENTGYVLICGLFELTSKPNFGLSRCVTLVLNIPCDSDTLLLLNYYYTSSPLLVYLHSPGTERTVRSASGRHLCFPIHSRYGSILLILEICGGRAHLMTSTFEFYLLWVVHNWCPAMTEDDRRARRYSRPPLTSEVQMLNLPIPDPLCLRSAPYTWSSGRETPQNIFSPSLQWLGPANYYF